MDMQGELLKKGQKRTAVGDSWKKRHFVYNKATRALRYFKGAPDGQPKGEVMVRGVDPRQDLQGAAKHKPHRFDFILADDTGKRLVLAVSAADAAVRQQWLDAVGTQAPDSTSATHSADAPGTLATAAAKAATAITAVQEAADTATDAAALRSAMAEGDLNASAQAAIDLAESAMVLRGAKGKKDQISAVQDLAAAANGQLRKSRRKTSPRSAASWPAWPQQRARSSYWRS